MNVGLIDELMKVSSEVCPVEDSKSYNNGGQRYSEGKIILSTSIVLKHTLRSLLLCRPAVSIVIETVSRIFLRLEALVPSPFV